MCVWSYFLSVFEDKAPLVDCHGMASLPSKVHPLALRQEIHYIFGSPHIYVVSSKV